MNAILLIAISVIWNILREKIAKRYKPKLRRTCYL